MNQTIFWKSLRDEIAEKLDGSTLLTEDETQAIIRSLDYIDTQIAGKGNAELSATASIRRRIADEANINEHSLAEMVGALSHRIWTLEIACENAAKSLSDATMDGNEQFLKYETLIIADILNEYGQGKTPKLKA